MGKVTDEIKTIHKTFIEKQHMFFVASAPLSENGHVNLSPKGMDSFRVLSPNKVAYLDFISSGNETSAHTLENGRITFMFCSFDGSPQILRLYGQGKVILPNMSEWNKISNNFELTSAVRQIIVADIHRVQTSCGFGVPIFEFKGQRDIHKKWADKMGNEKLEKYMIENNLVSLDGLSTHLGKIH